VGSVQHVFAWCSGYGAGAPTPGEHGFLAWPYGNAQSFQLFVDACAAAFPERWNICLWDNSGAHTAPHIRWPAQGRCVWLPPDGPELNPSERLWRDRKDDLAWQQFPTIAAQLNHVGQVLRADDPSTLQSLTSDPYLVEAINALAS
jgi:hypothetical protein